MIKPLPGRGGRRRLGITKRLPRPRPLSKIMRLVALIAIFLCLGYLTGYFVDVIKTKRIVVAPISDGGLRLRAILEAKRQGKSNYQFSTQKAPPPIAGQ